MPSVEVATMFTNFTATSLAIRVIHNKVHTAIHPCSLKITATTGAAMVTIIVTTITVMMQTTAAMIDMKSTE